jgi:anti-sigma-K factor RskA
MSDHFTRELLPGFVLGSLEPGEERAVREHVAGCDSCRQELEGLQGVTDSLALLLPSAEPSADFAGRLAARVRSRAGAAAGTGIRGRRALRIRAIGAVASILIVALAAGNILQLTSRVPPASATGAAPLTTAILRGTPGYGDAYGTMVLDPADNHGVLAVRGLPVLDATHQYQLWLIRDGTRKSGGVFGVNADGYGSLMLEVPPDFRGFNSVGISLEPFGGSHAPTGPAVMRGTL